MDLEINIKIGGTFCTIVALLQIVLVVLKSSGNISWSWPLVFIPLWGSFLLFVFVACIIIAIYVLTNDTGGRKH